MPTSRIRGPSWARQNEDGVEELRLGPQLSGHDVNVSCSSLTRLSACITSVPINVMQRLPCRSRSVGRITDVVDVINPAPTITISASPIIQSQGFVLKPLPGRRYASMVDWKLRHGCGEEVRVFSCHQAYPDFRDAMLRRGWFQNDDLSSNFFDLKWGLSKDVDYSRLRPHQIVNHFLGSDNLTTKVGLSLTLRECVWCCGVDADEFYPRAFDFYDSRERASFVADYKVTKADAVLRLFCQHLESTHRPDKTFSRQVVEAAVHVCVRQLADINDVIDCPDLCDNSFGASAAEWNILCQVCLEDEARTLPASLSPLEFGRLINKKPRPKTLLHATERETDREVEREHEDRLERREALENRARELLKEKKESKTGRSKTKLKRKNKNAKAMELLVPPGTYDDAAGTVLVNEVRKILEALTRSGRQRRLNGARNAWILKPAKSSRSRGIQVVRELDHIFRETQEDNFQWVCQKYLERPQLIHGFKFDIRQWVLVTNWNPLTVYLWEHPYLRFAGSKYDETISTTHPSVHLTTNCTSKDAPEGTAALTQQEQQFREGLEQNGFMWFVQQYEEWLHKTYCPKRTDQCQRCCHTPWLREPPYTMETLNISDADLDFGGEEGEEEIRDHDVQGQPAPPKSRVPVAPGGYLEGETVASEEPCSSRSSSEPETTSQRREEAAPKAAGQASASDEPCENLWQTCVQRQIADIVIWTLRCATDCIHQRSNSVELYGYDFMVAEGPERPEVWLLEVNRSPSVGYCSRVKTPLVKRMLEDTAKVLVDLPENPSASTGDWKLLSHPYESQVVPKPPASSAAAFLAGNGPVPSEHVPLRLDGSRIRLPRLPKRSSKKLRGSVRPATIAFPVDRVAGELGQDATDSLSRDTDRKSELICSNTGTLKEANAGVVAGVGASSNFSCEGRRNDGGDDGSSSFGDDDFEPESETNSSDGL